MKKISLKNLDSFGMERLSKDDLKKVVGGSVEVCGVLAGGTPCPDGMCCSEYGYCGTSDEYCAGRCQDDAICHFEATGQGTVQGTCSQNSRKQCVCGNGSSSTPHDACLNTVS